MVSVREKSPDVDCSCICIARNFGVVIVVKHQQRVLVLSHGHKGIGNQYACRGARIRSPAQNARVRDIVRKKIAEPLDIVCGCPRIVSMSVESVNGDNAGTRWNDYLVQYQGDSLLYNRIIPLCHNQ